MEFCSFFVWNFDTFTISDMRELSINLTAVHFNERRYFTLHLCSNQVDLEGNGIYDNIGHGLLVSGEATIVKNDIFYNQLAAVNLEGGANIEVIHTFKA